MRVLVCGDRNWNDSSAVSAALFGWNALIGDDPDYVVIEGGARGADAAGAEWAKNFATEHIQFPADWKQFGRAAGPIRNQQMLVEGKPDLVLAFHDDLASSKGTRHMVETAKRQGFPVYIISRA